MNAGQGWKGGARVEGRAGSRGWGRIVGVGEEGVEERGVVAGDTPTYEHQLWLVSLNLQ